MREFAKEIISEINPDIVMNGGAQGFDQACAEACIELKIPFEVAVPFSGQDSKWPSEARLIYRKILDKASSIHVVCEKYSTKSFIERDFFMVDWCDSLLCLFDGKKNGGTFHTSSYAESKHKIIYNCWDRWKVYFKG